MFHLIISSAVLLHGVSHAFQFGRGAGRSPYAAMRSARSLTNPYAGQRARRSELQYDPYVFQRFSRGGKGKGDEKGKSGDDFAAEQLGFKEFAADTFKEIKDKKGMAAANDFALEAEEILMDYGEPMGAGLTRRKRSTQDDQVLNAVERQPQLNRPLSATTQAPGKARQGRQNPPLTSQPGHTTVRPGMQRQIRQGSNDGTRNDAINQPSRSTARPATAMQRQKRDDAVLKLKMQPVITLEKEKEKPDDRSVAQIASGVKKAPGMVLI